MTLDGSPMEVSITGEPTEFHAPKSVFDRLEPQQKNVRAGLFGTAIDAEDSSSSGGPSFSVTLGGAAEPFGRQAKLVQPFHSGSHHSNNNASSAIVQPFASKNTHQPAGQSQGRGRGMKEGPNFLFRDDAEDQQATRGLRQPFAQQDRQQQNNRSNGNQQRGQQNDRRANGSNNGSSRGKGNNQQQKRDSNRPAKPAAASATDLDADLDAYFAK